MPGDSFSPVRFPHRPLKQADESCKHETSTCQVRTYRWGHDVSQFQTVPWKLKQTEKKSGTAYPIVSRTSGQLTVRAIRNIYVEKITYCSIDDQPAPRSSFILSPPPTSGQQPLYLLVFWQASTHLAAFNDMIRCYHNHSCLQYFCYCNSCCLMRYLSYGKLYCSALCLFYVASVLLFITSEYEQNTSFYAVRGRLQND